MNVGQIIKKYLEDHDFDGLYHDGYECGCKLKNMFLCDCVTVDCKPGYKHTDKDGNWRITGEKNNETSK
ncbi:hypothetical protein KAR91_63830 [Candidatus Pacearchaeota archaeon]|nr:hypothetical protein [Candidatus Pacearchaeota archaeon]